MSQGGPVNNTGSGSAAIETLTGNSGGAVSPDGAFDIDVLGDNSTGIDIVGTPGSNLLTISGIASTTSQVGTVELATDAETIAGSDSSRSIVPSSLAAKLGSQTDHGVAIGNATSGALNWTTSGTSGQVLTSNGAASDPTFQDNLSSVLIQEVSASQAAVVTITTGFVFDDTIPQVSETDEIITLAITPTSATSILEIKFTGWAANAAGGGALGLGIFQDANTSALSATITNTAASAGQRATCEITHIMTAGTASSTTFKVGAGTSGNTFYFNAGSAGTRLLGGVSRAWLTIKEYSP